ncbi:hypothetical protein NOS3756_59830 (plasmid) [Nostoc sp. NIES-3756]|uniref:hypothetical protein n=1 Tax=Nostoc sp. NIES-3756 TaxID=1751286 RepID=UPI00071FBA17|nr:hypothetical protein [Nostoc sp. NIES-3756]BAT56971.1 hypothetical protein NOS3756_59830 [Nostoc sp. NIES-3756]
MSTEAPKVSEQMTNVVGLSSEVSDYTEKVTVINATEKALTKADIILSDVVSDDPHNHEERTIELASPGNKIPAAVNGKDQQRDSKVYDPNNPDLNKKFKFQSAKFKFQFEGNSTDFEMGSYKTLGKDRFIQQIELKVGRSDGKYVQVTLDDQRPLSQIG